MIYLLVGIGGAIGSIARYVLTDLITLWLGDTLPWGTILINITGSFLIGIFASFGGPESALVTNHSLRTFLMVGICGGYTTFSSFSLQTLNLANNGNFLLAGANILLSVALCLVAVWLGFMLGSLFD